MVRQVLPEVACRYIATLWQEVRIKVTTITSRSFNQELSKAKKAAETGPVYITDRGKPAHVLLTYEQFKQLTGSRRSILDALIASTAYWHGMAVVTRNTQDFDGLGVELINPWLAPFSA